MRRLASNRNGKSPQFWVLTGFLVLAFLIGGGSRADIQSLVILRPLAVLFCAFSLATLQLRDIQENRFLFLFAALLFVLIGLQLVPLPPEIWTKLPGRDIISHVDHAAGLGDVWRPFSMVPAATWNAFFSLFVPLGVLLACVQLEREERFALQPVLLGLGLLSGLLGIFQVIGSPTGPLYFFRITNNGSAVGLFANRNHAAVFLACIFPMLAVLASTGAPTVEKSRSRLWIALVGGSALVPLLLVTGSRLGIVAGLVGLILSLALYQKPVFDRPAKRKVKRSYLGYLFVGFGAVAAGLITIVFSRARAFERLAAPDQADDLRFQIWGPVAKMAWKYFPFGSGTGTFVETYQVDEAARLISPIYVNHAHNDWLETAVTTGLIGIFLVFLAIAASLFASVRAWRASNARSRDTLFARLGSIIILIFALASATDYPLRTPSLMCLAVVAAIWLSGPGRQPTKLHIPKRDGSGAKSQLAA